jgi:branched-chain amino acid transport system ATP-binding protein
VLQVQGLSAFYGKIQALRDVSLQIEQNELVSIIGANGAGKSTLLKSIMGAVSLQKGHILLEGKEITKLDSIEIVKLGISLVPEGRQLFGPLTVKENLTLGSYLRYKDEDSKVIDEDFEFVYSLFPVLRERRQQIAETLSGGEQQMLAIARGIMSKPKLLLLDELSLGIAPILVREIYNTITKLKKQGLTLLLVEQNALIALNIAERSYVLETGRIMIEGKSKELLDKQEVRNAYLGGKAHR